MYIKALDGDIKHELLVRSWKLKSTSWNSEVRVHIHQFWVQIYELRVQIHELDFKSRSYDFKSTSSRIIQSMKTQQP